MARFRVTWIQLAIRSIHLLCVAFAEYLRKNGDDIILSSLLGSPGVPAEVLPFILCEANHKFKIPPWIFLLGQESNRKLRREVAIDNRPDRAPGAILIRGKVTLQHAMHSEKFVRIKAREFINVGNVKDL